MSPVTEMMLIDLANFIEADHRVTKWADALPILQTWSIASVLDLQVSSLNNKQRRFLHKFASYGDASQYNSTLEQVRLVMKHLNQMAETSKALLNTSESFNLALGQSKDVS